MTLLIKDANTSVQAISTGVDVAGNLVPVHASASLAGGVATPVSSAAPLPVINAAGAVAADGSGTVANGGTAQTLFGGIAPVNGYLIANNSSATLYVSDVGTATPGGASLPIAAGSILSTPSGYKPAGAVSLYGGTTGQAFAARRW
ncbi:MAG TPA: hypothetical protein VGF34_13385 [Stellaceae bacterium]